MLKNKNYKIFEKDLKFVVGEKLKKLSKIIVGTLATLTLTSFFAVAPSVFASGRPMTSYSQENFLCDPIGKTITITGRLNDNDAKFLKEKIFNKNNPEKWSWSLTIGKNGSNPINTTGLNQILKDIPINNLTIESNAIVVSETFKHLFINNLIIKPGAEVLNSAFYFVNINNLTIETGAEVSNSAFANSYINVLKIGDTYCNVKESPYIINHCTIDGQNKTIKVTGALSDDDAKLLKEKFFNENNSTKWLLVIEKNGRVPINGTGDKITLDNVTIKSRAEIYTWAFSDVTINNLTIESGAKIYGMAFLGVTINNVTIKSGAEIYTWAFHKVNINHLKVEPEANINNNSFFESNVLWKIYNF